MTKDFECFFHIFFVYLFVYLLWWDVCSDFLPIFKVSCFLIVCWVLRIVCVFWMPGLYQGCSVNIFSQPMAWVFVLCSSVIYKEVFNFTKSSLSIFSLTDYAFGETHCQTQGHLDFLFSSKSFTGLHFTFRFRSHLS